MKRLLLSPCQMQRSRKSFERQMCGWVKWPPSVVVVQFD